MSVEDFSREKSWSGRSGRKWIFYF